MNASLPPPRFLPVLRPRVRRDCAAVPRPCPFVSCRHNLFLEVTPNGAIRENFPGLEPDQMLESCSLDVADRGEHKLRDIAPLIGATYQFVQQVEWRAFRKIALLGARRAGA